MLPNGRSLTHPTLVAPVLIILVWRYAVRRDRSDLAVAFGAGYPTHFAAGAMVPLLAREYADLAFPGWLLLPPIEYVDTPSVTARVSALFSDLAADDVEAIFALEGILVVHGVLRVRLAGDGCLRIGDGLPARGTPGDDPCRDYTAPIETRDFAIVRIWRSAPTSSRPRDT